MKTQKIKKIRLRGEIFDVEVCDSILSRARGLMFRKNPKPLLFIFKKPTKQSIHSFFCKPFKAIWLHENRIIEEKTVKPFCFSIKSKKPYTKLLEIPLRNN